MRFCYLQRKLLEGSVFELVTMTVKFPNFHVDTSAYVLHRLPPGFVDWMKGVGASRVMFGTNWPMLSPAKCLAGLPRLELSSDQQTAFLRVNALHVFGLQSSGRFATGHKGRRVGVDQCTLLRVESFSCPRPYSESFTAA